MRNDWVLDIFQIFCSPFFQLHCYFCGRRVICDIAVHSPIFAPPPPPPAHIYWNRAATQKKRWETIVFQWLFSSSTHLFSIKLLFFGLLRDPGYLSSQLDFCPAVPTTHLRVLRKSGYVKIMVWIHFVLTILQFVCSRFFQLNCYFWAIAGSMISQPTDGFSQCRCGRPFLFITTERQHKKWWESIVFWQFFSYFAALFSIKMLFLG